MSNEHERNLVKEFVEAKIADKIAKDNAKAAATRFAIAKVAIVEHLEGTDCTATASYQGMGRVQSNKPTLYASYKVEDHEKLCDFLKEANRDDLVKETINKKSLSSYISECIEQGETLPSMVTYFLKPQLAIY